MKHFEDYNSLAGLATDAGSHRSSIWKLNSMDGQTLRDAHLPWMLSKLWQIHRIERVMHARATRDLCCSIIRLSSLQTGPSLEIRRHSYNVSQSWKRISTHTLYGATSVVSLRVWKVTCSFPGSDSYYLEYTFLWFYRVLLETISDTRSLPATCFGLSYTFMIFVKLRSQPHMWVM
jgi:hypothetical protein